MYISRELNMVLEDTHISSKSSDYKIYIFHWNLVGKLCVMTRPGAGNLWHWRKKEIQSGNQIFILVIRNTFLSPKDNYCGTSTS